MSQEIDTLTKTARRFLGKGWDYQPRAKQEGEALPPSNDLFERGTYRTGDGDPGTYVPRPGSLVAFTLPSRGIQ